MLTVQLPTIPKPNNLVGPKGGESGVEFFVGFLGNLAVSLLGIMGILAVLFIIFGALRIIVSGGDQDKAKSGWTTITNAVIGLLIASLSYAIVQMVVKLPYEVLERPRGDSNQTINESSQINSGGQGAKSQLENGEVKGAKSQLENGDVGGAKSQLEGNENSAGEDGQGAKSQLENGEVKGAKSQLINS